MQSTPEKGLDDIFKTNENAAPIAKLQDLDSNDALEIYSKRNGLVVYTANALDNTLSFTRGLGRPQMGIAMEAQLCQTPITIPVLAISLYQLTNPSPTPSLIAI